MISSASSTADTPRAHLTNAAALECLRDLDTSLYEECLSLGFGGSKINNFRYCETMAGEEYARNLAWGNGKRKSDYELVSPCHYMDFPQNLLEPLLVKWATTRGWSMRFDTRLVSFTEEVGDNGKGEDDSKRNITATVMDQFTGLEYTIRTRYMFGADGGRSTIAKQLDLPFTTLPGGGFAYNILLRADIAHLMQHREGNLHMCMRLEKDYPFITTARMVKPWYEWMFVVLPKGPTAPIPKRSTDEWKEIVQDLIGDKSVDVKILNVSGWAINETSADVISKGNVFCLGDAVHRHPPTLGLGSNTCIQDSFNLSWKIYLVLSGLADPSLLSTYNSERQPVGEHLVKESNEILRKHAGVWGALGVQPYGASEAERKRAREVLKENSQEGKERRKVLMDSVRTMHRETHGLGTAMAQLYSSPAIYPHDELEPFQPGIQETQDPAQYYEPSTYPGRRLPHVWLGTNIPSAPRSTLDVAGKGKFALFTGIGGEGWGVAAETIKKDLGVDITMVNVGIGLEWEDVYLDWDEKRGVEEDGCVLVRPDYFVAWRAQSSGDEVARLTRVMCSVLGLAESESAKYDRSDIEGRE
ncbi:hypothetical protein P153DRAFT_286624 [Dothidotthia symphoricarpi CBS 119687]|uniref:FAD-binding domain-containing protein n=1 Tax=Dothidotthia symphoricarpi CBS 119687 TaxID=1392245 RepID=A0A6A6ALV4_9PLEO|nr:uncharacterized protein P153DRAFT_286624 [Dothidotthia symphoricarpi CBS 119687]KAF2131451.1 hypothetical protein P153DRAFT_286624 [Dothidotthia symphoricarpi CBS 119687]